MITRRGIPDDEEEHTVVAADPGWLVVQWELADADTGEMLGLPVVAWHCVTRWTGGTKPHVTVEVFPVTPSDDFSDGEEYWLLSPTGQVTAPYDQDFGSLEEAQVEAQRRMLAKRVGGA